MNISIEKDGLSSYVLTQLQSFLPDSSDTYSVELLKLMSNTLDRLEYCFSHINLPHYSDSQNNAKFDHLHSDQYCMYLYLLSNEAYKAGFKELYIRLSVLNRYLNGIDLFGHVQMPDIFLLVHPIGTIIGRANFKNYLCIYQGVTIGGTHKNDEINYPSFEEKVNLFAHSKIIGNCKIGENVTFGANAFIINKDIDSNSVVTGSYPNCSVNIKQNQWSLFNSQTV